jgi:hypothetical protein
LRDADDNDNLMFDIVNGGEEEDPSSPLALLSSLSSLFRNRAASAPDPRTRVPAACAVPRGEGPSAATT